MGEERDRGREFFAFLSPDAINKERGRIKLAFFLLSLEDRWKRKVGGKVSSLAGEEEEEQSDIEVRAAAQPESRPGVGGKSEDNSLLHSSLLSPGSSSSSGKVPLPQR